MGDRAILAVMMAWVSAVVAVSSAPRSRTWSAWATSSHERSNTVASSDANSGSL